MMQNETQPSTAKRKTYARELDQGHHLEAAVSPCVFTYPGYPLQIQVTLYRSLREPLGAAFVVDRGKTAANYSDADVKVLLASIRTRPCPRCSSLTFDPDTVETNRGGLCEACFLAELESELAAVELAEQQETATRDLQQKQAGMAVRVRAWVHPQGGGDDYQGDWYFKARPTPEQVADLLKEQGSCILDDYELVIL